MMGKPHNDVKLNIITRKIGLRKGLPGGVFIVYGLGEAG